MVPIKSVLNKIIEQVYCSKSLTEAQSSSLTLINSSGINDKDKRKMIYEISNQKSLTRLQFYLTNAMLKYEGLGVNDKKSEKVYEETEN